MVRLDDDPYTIQEEHTVSVFTRLLNCVRIHNVPAINLGIISVLAFFLLKLTTKYNELYMKNSLITIIVTNLVLYGISETLAQTLLCYKSESPRLSIRLNDTQTTVSFNSDDISFGNTNNEEYEVEETAPADIDDTIDDENVDRFLDYLRSTDTESINSESANFGTNLTQQLLTTSMPITYFQFGRLAGFMCWGFIMSFFQCWWYKFLQIYSKHPQFIEVLRKVMLDQFCYSPLSLFAFFTYGTIVLENGTWDDTRDKLRRVYLKTLMVNYSVWFPVQFINFLLVPRPFQVPFSSSVSVLWNCFLSMRNSTS
ncbi:CIC11C00000000187 [Sungouiella intermedia]|uniref:CIC11C00000000187 n=1 Tax=Sungouiella intermedia TaxID=45354 RepID=A0A1L0DHL2_9ASCO|nr:CIC11C00000000187 [[Candida] intermedia]